MCQQQAVLCELQVQALEKKIRTVCARIFKDFSKRVGLDDISEHDKKMQEARQAREEQLGILRGKVDELELDRKRLAQVIEEADGKKLSLQKKEKVRFTSSDMYNVVMSLAPAHQKERVR